jgi:hypothetical protein
MRAAAPAPAACILALLSTAAALPAPSAGSLFGLHGGSALPIEIRAAGAAAAPADANITLDVGAAVPVPETLYGAFFEEIGHAGDGGLFAELVQDRSFDALAAAAGFSSSSENGARLEVDLGALGAASAARSAAAAAQRAALAAAGIAAGGSPHASLAAARRRHAAAPNAPAVAWSALPGTQTALSRAAPLAAGNPVALEVRPPGEDGGYGAGGVVNSGYWGFWLRGGGEYGASLFVRNPGPKAANVTLALLSSDLETLHARLELSAPPGGAWTRLAGGLRATAADRDARLAVLVDAPVVLDTVSLFPAENVRRGEAMGLTTPYPFRTDLLQRLKDLAPAFLRIPGGCFVEGDKLANAFRWKPTAGPAETRPGHWNRECGQINSPTNRSPLTTRLKSQSGGTGPPTASASSSTCSSRRSWARARSGSSMRASRTRTVSSFEIRVCFQMRTCACASFSVAPLVPIPLLRLPQASRPQTSSPGSKTHSTQSSSFLARPTRAGARRARRWVARRPGPSSSSRSGTRTAARWALWDLEFTMRSQRVGTRQYRMCPPAHPSSSSLFPPPALLHDQLRPLLRRAQTAPPEPRAHRQLRPRSRRAPGPLGLACLHESRAHV